MRIAASHHGSGGRYTGSSVSPFWASRLNGRVEGIRSRFPSLQENRPTIVNAAVQ
jgi:hypothetical protein